MKKLSNTKKLNNENSNLINIKSINTRIEQEVCNETLSFSSKEKDKITSECVTF